MYCESYHLVSFGQFREHCLIHKHNLWMKFSILSLIALFVLRFKLKASRIFTFYLQKTVIGPVRFPDTTILKNF